MPALSATFSGDASPLLKQIQMAKVELGKLAQGGAQPMSGSQGKWWDAITRSGAEMQRTRQKAFAEQLAGQRGLSPTDFMVTPQALAKGKTSMRIASTMFVSAIRDSFASLASGQSPITIFLQQAPQVAQGLVMMGRAAVMTALRWLPIGAAVLAAGGVLVHFHNQAKRAKEMLESMVEPFAALAKGTQPIIDALQKMRLHMDAFADSLKNIVSPGQAMREEMDDEEKALKRNHDTQKKLLELKKQTATARGRAGEARSIDDQIRAEEKSYEEKVIAAKKTGLKRIQKELSSSELESDIESRATSRANSEVEQTKMQIEDLKAAIKQMEEWRAKFHTQKGHSAEELAQASGNTLNIVKSEFEMSQLEMKLPDQERAAAAASRQSERTNARALEFKRMEHDQQRDINNLTADNAAQERQRAAEAAQPRRQAISDLTPYGVNSDQQHGMFGPGTLAIGEKQVARLDTIIAVLRQNRRGVQF